MQRWISDNPYQAGMLAGLTVFLAVTLLLAWIFGRDKRFSFRPLDIVIGFGCVYPVVLVLAWTVRLSDFASGFCQFAGFTLAYVLALSVAKVRSTRAIRRDEAARAAARAAIPAPAREYFGRDGFARVLDGAGDLPAPDVASDVIAYWTFRALDSGDYAEWSRSIHYATAIKGWRMSSPTLAASVPWLVHPFLCSADKPWDPGVDQQFRDRALSLLDARFGARAPVPA